MKTLATFFLMVLAVSCTRPCHDYAISGADDFVIDSYKIRQGKSAILELEGICVAELPDDAMDEYKDMIAEGDVLNIVIYHPSRKDRVDSFHFINTATRGFLVIDGKIDIPDAPPIPVLGLSLDEAKVKIEETLREQIKDVEVFLSYFERLSHKVELAGLVGVPCIPVDGKIRLFEVLSKAKIAPGANLFMSYVARNGELLDVDLYRLINKGDMCQNIVMRPGDKIFIACPQDSTAMLMGEVGYPRAVNLPYGTMSLREALVSAGGIPYTGDKSCIQVIRGNLLCPKIYVLSWDHIIHLPNDSLLLMPGDTVYVSAKPITEWNRFIAQLLPSISGTMAAYEVYRITK